MFDGCAIRCKFRGQNFIKKEKNRMKFFKNFVLMILAIMFVIACNSPEFTSAKVYLGQGEKAQAEEWFLKALQTEPTNSEVPFMLGAHIYRDQNKWVEMNEMFDRSLEIDNRFATKIDGIRKKDWQTHYNKGANAYNKHVTGEDQQERFLSRAIESFETAILIAPDEIKTYGILATCCLLAEDQTNAKQYFLTAIKMDPNEVVNYKSLSSIYLEEENFDAAIDIIQKACNIDSQNAVLVQQLASIYYNLGQKELALETFQKALMLDSENVDLMYNIGIMYYQDNDFQNATPWMEKANKKLPKDIDIIKVLINCYQKIDNPGQTEIFARKALEIDPQDRKIMMALYKSLLDQGKGESDEVKHLLKQLQ